MKSEKMKRTLAVLLMFAIFFTYLPMEMSSSRNHVYAAEEAWQGNGTSPDELEYDSDSDAYLISSGEDLAGFAQLVNEWGECEANARLTACIDLEDREWTPIGSYGSYYGGTFDGDGHTVSGLMMQNEEGHEAMGLFGVVDGATVKNITVEGSLQDETSSAVYIGGIAGIAQGSTSFYRCSSNTEIISGEQTYSGGIIGAIDSSGTLSVEQCSNLGSVTGGYAGGIIGQVGSSWCNLTVTDCYNKGDVTALCEYTCAGGIIGCGSEMDYGDSLKKFTIKGGIFNTGNISGSRGYEGFQFFGMMFATTFSKNNIDAIYCTGTSYDYAGSLTKYDMSSDFADFLDWTGPGWGNYVGAADGTAVLSYQGEKHSDAQAATDEEKEAALKELDTYKSEENYYAEQWEEIQKIISDVKQSVMEDSGLSLSDVESKITKTKEAIDAVKDKEWIDAVNSGLSDIDNLLKDKNEDDYDTEDWNNIMSSAEKARNDIKKVTILSSIASIVSDTATAINNVMTKADKAAIGELRSNAKREVSTYIDAINAEYAADLLLVEDNEYASELLKSKQEAIAETKFSLYLDGGSEASKVDSMTLKSDIQNWISESKAALDEYKMGGKLIQISDADDLLNFAELVNKNGLSEAFGILTDDIDVSEKSWTPIGSSTSKPFKGVFLGNSKKIKINFTQKDYSYAGLFGAVDGAHIEDVTVEGMIKGINSSSYGTAGIAGCVCGSGTTTIRNCINAAEIVGQSSHAGGIVGRIAGSSVLTVENSKNTGAVSAASASYAGGIVGCSSNSTKLLTISNCDNNGTVSGAKYTGGILGYTVKETHLTGCSNTGNIDNTKGTSGAGGIVCYAENTDIRDCSNNGDVTAKQYAGGIAGQIKNNTTINCCYNSGKIYSNDSNGLYLGGIAGSIAQTAKVSFCFNSGEVYTKGYGAGGIAGQVAYNAETPENVYNIGVVHCDRTWKNYGSGAIVGGFGNSTAYVLNDSYYALEGTSDVLLYRNTDNVTPDSEKSGFKTADEIKEESFIPVLNDGLLEGKEGFVISELGVNDGYPTFHWETDKIKAKLSAMKEDAKNEIRNGYDPEDYYIPQKDQVKQAIIDAISAIDEIKNSLGAVELTKAEWQKKIDEYYTKVQIQNELSEKKKEACEKLDEYSDFSGYNDSTLKEVENVKKSIELAVTSGKNAVNAITPEEYAPDFDIVNKTLSEYEELIDTLYMTAGVWDGNKVDDKYQPDKLDGVWQIENAVELAWYAQNINNGSKITQNAVLIGDIDLGNRLWTPIGSSMNNWRGVFDGNGHTVYGLNIDTSGNVAVAGLFGYAGSSLAIIRNLTVCGKIQGAPELSGIATQGYGGIAGVCQGTVFNCVSRVDIIMYEMSSTGDENYVGGIVGNGSSVLYCRNEGFVKGRKYVGGIIGNCNTSGTVMFCVNEGNVEGTSHTGGIAGCINSSDKYKCGSVIRSCCNKGNVKGSGIVGYAYGEYERISNVYNVGEVTVAGIISTMGTKNLSQKDTIAHEGIVSNAYNAYVGTGAGIISGFYQGNLENCYDLAAISGETADTEYTSIVQCRVINEDQLKAYGSVLGTAFCDDVNNINGGLPLLVFETDDSETRDAKAEAVSEILSVTGSISNVTKYGSQYGVLKETGTLHLYNIESSKTAEEVKIAKENALEALAAVKTEIELARENAIKKMIELTDKNVYSAENEEIAEQLISEAGKALEACVSIESISPVEKEYTLKLEAISTYTEDTISELNTEKNKLAEDKKLTSAKVKELGALIANAEKLIDLVQKQKEEGQINSETAREKIDDIFAETKKALTEAAEEETALPEIETEESDELREAKEAAYAEVLAEVSEGLADDYGEKQWKEILDILEAAGEDIGNAQTQSDIDAAKQSSIKKIKEIPTAENILRDETALSEKKQTAKKQISELLKEVELLAEENKQKALDTIENAQNDIDEVNLEHYSLAEAIAKVEEISNEAAEKIKKLVEDIKDKTWVEAVSEPIVQDGTYLISTAEELAWISSQVADGVNFAGKKFVLVDDIDLAGKMWKSIGTRTSTDSNIYFAGNFDGNGHSIKNMNVLCNEGSAGLFGYVKKGKINNLTVSGRIVSSGNTSATKAVYVGGIAGYLEDAEVTSCVSKVDFVSTITIEQAGYSSALSAGGIAGKTSEKVSIKECIFKGTVTGEYLKTVGGIVAEANNTSSGELTVSECANFGTVFYENRFTKKDSSGNEILPFGTGGIVGIADKGTLNLSHCYNAGTIHGNENIGGILGYAGSKDVTLKYSYNYGKITAETIYRGAITGKAVQGEYTNCLYMLRDSSSKAMGHIIVGNNVEILSSEELSSKAILEALQDGNSSFIASIGGVNSGYPIFIWQLTDNDMKAGIKLYINDYLDRNSFTEQQWSDVEKLISEASAAIDEADEPVEVSDAYENIIKELNAVKSLMKAQIVKNIEAVSTDEYDSELAKTIKDYIGKTVESIKADDISAKDAERIYDEARAHIVDMIINNIDEEITSSSADKIHQARDAYESLSQIQQESVSGYMKLVQAENTQSSDMKTAEKAVKLIDAIGTVTKNSEPVIKAARQSFDLLTAAQKTYISDDKINALTAAETMLKTILEKEAELNSNNIPVSYDKYSGPSRNFLYNMQSGETGQIIEDAVKSVDSSADKNLIKDGTVVKEPNKEVDKAGFDWSILPIGIGIVALLALAYAIIYWFGAAKKRKKQ